MIRRDLDVVCDTGIKGKTAARLIDTASSFISDINIENGEKKANAKSLLGVLALEIKKGDKVTIDIHGNDESKAVGEIEKCFC